MTPAQIRAVLFAAIRFLAGTGRYAAFIDRTDWNDVGVPADVFEQWWKSTRPEDEQRRAAEAAIVRKKNRYKEIVSKLSDVDLAVIGVKREPPENL